MSQPEPLVRNISDTACWVAVYRAAESERPDAVFRDPLAKRLAGERGQQIAAATQLTTGEQFSNKNTWPWVARTYLFDRFIMDQIQQGTDLVVNLAAGLDTRPYRLALPPSLQWVEVDLSELLAYKQEVLANEKPVCALERISVDLADVAARRELFEQLGRRAKRALILSEGFLVYLTADEVAALAKDLAAVSSFQRWVIDLASPGLMQMLQKKLSPTLSQTPLKFAPEEGPGFFTPHGWKPEDVQSLLKTAAKLKRLSFFMRLIALLPDSKGRQGSRPWGGVCLMARS